MKPVYALLYVFVSIMLGWPTGNSAGSYVGSMVAQLGWQRNVAYTICFFLFGLMAALVILPIENKLFWSKLVFWKKLTEAFGDIVERYRIAPFTLVFAIFFMFSLRAQL